MSADSIIQLLVLIATALGIAGTVIWRTGTLAWHLGQMKAEMNATNQEVGGLRSWLQDLKAGDSPVCARHEQQLEEHERRLGRLENGPAGSDMDGRRAGHR